MKGLFFLLFLLTPTATTACGAPTVSYSFVAEGGEAFPDQMVEVVVTVRECVTIPMPPKRGELRDEEGFFHFAGQFNDGEVRGDIYVSPN